MKIKSCFLLLFFAVTTLFADYVHIDELCPGQLRFSSMNLKEKIEDALKKGHVTYDSSSKAYVGAYLEGKSILPEKDALPVVKSAFGYVLTDGHHHVLAALVLELPWIPIKEIEDRSTLSEACFWQVAEENGWAYLYDLAGNRCFPPHDFTRLEDDPNRYFAAITARKYPANGDLSQSRGAEYPLWIKVGKDIPFIEFRISDALLAQDFHYTYEMGIDPDVAFVEKARDILLQAEIPRLRVVPERKHYSELKESNS